MSKQSSASALAHLRWANATTAEKSATGKRLAAAAAKSMTKAQKQARARKAALARHKKAGHKMTDTH